MPGNDFPARCDNRPSRLNSRQLFCDFGAEYMRKPNDHKQPSDPSNDSSDMRNVRPSRFDRSI